MNTCGFMKKKLEFEYYYKNSGCKARSSTDKECICWYREGTGPMSRQLHTDDFPAVEWRIVERIIQQ